MLQHLRDTLLCKIRLPALIESVQSGTSHMLSLFEQVYLGSYFTCTFPFAESLTETFTGMLTHHRS